MTFPICPCDGDDIAAPTNLPQLSQHRLSRGHLCRISAARC